MAGLRVRWAEANAARKAVEEQLGGLRSLRRPGDVADLSARLAAADEEIARRAEAGVAAEKKETGAEADRADLPEHAALSRWRDAHVQSAKLAGRLERARE